MAEACPAPFPDAEQVEVVGVKVVQVEGGRVQLDVIPPRDVFDPAYAVTPIPCFVLEGRTITVTCHVRKLTIGNQNASWPIIPELEPGATYAVVDALTGKVLLDDLRLPAP